VQAEHFAPPEAYAPPPPAYEAPVEGHQAQTHAAPAHQEVYTAPYQYQEPQPDPYPPQPYQAAPEPQQELAHAGQAGYPADGPDLFQLEGFYWNNYQTAGGEQLAGVYEQTQGQYSGVYQEVFRYLQDGNENGGA